MEKLNTIYSSTKQYLIALSPAKKMLLMLALLLVATLLVFQFQKKNTVVDRNMLREDKDEAVSDLENMYTNELYTLNELDFNILQYDDKPLVINFWRTDSAFSKDELSNFAKLQEENIDELSVVTINRGEKAADVIEYVDENGLKDRLIFTIDPGDSIAGEFEITNIPETLFLNSDGNIVFRRKGFLSYSEMNEYISQLD